MNREPQTLPAAAYAFARNQFRPFNRTAVCAISEARNRLDKLRNTRRRSAGRYAGRQPRVQTRPKCKQSQSFFIGWSLR